MISVVVATRDRADVLRTALRSVAMQAGVLLDVVVVDDSRTEAGRAGTALVVAETVPGARIVAGDGGSGPGGARNRGIAAAQGALVAFLDDDDAWLDPDYLRRTEAAMTRLNLDLHLADQEAVRTDGSVVAGPVWIEDVAARLVAAGRVANDGTFVVTPAELMRSGGFAHLNTVVIRRPLLADRLGGFAADIRYEEDRELYLRAVDAASAIGYAPGIVARHNVPAGRASASTIAQAEREAARLSALDRALAAVRDPAVRARCRTDRAYTLKHMARRAAAAGEWERARRLGLAAMRGGAGLKWAGYVAFLYIRSAAARRSQPA